MKQLPRLAGLWAVIFWASGALLVLELGNLPPLFLMAVSGLITLVFISTFLWVMKREVIKSLSWGYFGVATLMLLLTQMCYVFAFRLAPAVQVDLINYLWPSFLVLLGGRCLTWFTRLLVVLSGSWGIYLALGPDGMQACYLPGYFLAFSSAVLWTLYSLFVQKHQLPPEYIGLGAGIGGPIFWVLHCLLGEPVCVPTLSEWGYLFLYGGGIYVVGYFCWGYAVNHGSVAEAGALSYCIPVLSVLLLILGGYAEFCPRVVWATFFVFCAAVIPVTFPFLIFLRKKLAN